MNNQKLQIYTLVQIPVDFVKNIDSTQYQQWICLGQSKTSSIMMSTIFYFFTYNKTEALKQLASPRKSYSSYESKMVAAYLLEAIQSGKKDKFIERMQQHDPRNERTSILLQDYCLIMLMDKYNKEQLLNQFANLFDLQIRIANYSPIGNGSHKINLFVANQCFYYLVAKVKQNIVAPQQIKQCWMCRQEATKYLIPNCQHLICLNCLLRGFKKQEEFQCRCNGNCNQKLNKKSLEYQQLLSSQLQSMPTSNQLTQSNKQQNGNQCLFQKCSYCSYEYRQLQLLSCNHQLCSQCLTLAKQKRLECLIEGCRLQKSDSIQSQPIDKYRSQERIDPLTTSSLFKQCNQCISSDQKSQLFINICQHSICKKCFPKLISSKDENRCRQRNCNQRIDKDSLRQFLNQQKIQFACCKCKENYLADDLYFNNQCYHAICFTCAQQMIEKKKSPKFICPEMSCNYNFSGSGFEEFYEQYQIKMLQQEAEFELQEQQMLKQQQQLKQTQLEEDSKNRVSRFQISNQSQLKQNKVDQQDQIQTNSLIQSQQQINSSSSQIQQECTMCNSPFNEYNLKQEIDCSIHRIGVCCIKQFQKCQQCETKKINQSAIRPKSKLILQTLQMPNQNDMIIQQNDYTENTRLNSRIQQTQSQIRNNTTDNSLFKSQNLKYKSNYGK